MQKEINQGWGKSVDTIYFEFWRDKVSHEQKIVCQEIDLLFNSLQYVSTRAAN